MKNYIVFYLRSDGTSDSTHTDNIIIEDVDSLPSFSDIQKLIFEKLAYYNGRVKSKGISGITEVSKDEIINWKK